MEIIITGATGTIGSAILRHCLTNPSITSIVALTRRPLPITHPKLSTITIDNWITWDSGVLSRILSADAAIWAIGTTDANREINYDYPLAFQESFLEARKASPHAAKRFRYIRVSGAFTEPDQDRSLWFYAGPRKLHGLAEARTMELAEKYNSVCQTFVVKPGGVSKKGDWGMLIGECLLGDGMAIRDETLGAFVADLAVNGKEEEGIVLNREMVEKGRMLLQEKAN